MSASAAPSTCTHRDGPSTSRMEPVAAEWVDLPEGTFKGQGTGVRTAIAGIDAEEPAAEAEPGPEVLLAFAGGRLF